MHVSKLENIVDYCRCMDVHIQFSSLFVHKILYIVRGKILLSAIKCASIYAGLVQINKNAEVNLFR